MSELEVKTSADGVVVPGFLSIKFPESPFSVVLSAEECRDIASRLMAAADAAFDR